MINFPLEIPQQNRVCNDSISILMATYLERKMNMFVHNEATWKGFRISVIRRLISFDSIGSIHSDKPAVPLCYIFPHDLAYCMPHKYRQSFSNTFIVIAKVRSSCVLRQPIVIFIVHSSISVCIMENCIRIYNVLIVIMNINVINGSCKIISKSIS